MDVYRVAFIGQGLLYNEAELRRVLEAAISKIIREHDAVEFYVSHENHFDTLATSAVRMVETSYSLQNSTVHLVLPHSVGKNDFFASYDGILYCLPTESDADRTMRNNHRIMIDQSDLVIGFVHEESGEAYQGINYAKSVEKPVRNLADEISDAEEIFSQENIEACRRRAKRTLR